VRISAAKKLRDNAERLGRASGRVEETDVVRASKELASVA
jgi:hypothetical protein